MQDSKKNAALEHKVIFEGLEQAEGNEESVVEMMSRINDYLYSSYFLAINPLPQLRNALPAYDWKFARPKSLREAREIVAKSDFIWRTDWFNSRWLDANSTEEDINACFPAEFATATLLNKREPLQYFFAGEKRASEETTMDLRFITACGGDPVYSEIVNK
jgi:hypothetical protein